MRRPLRTAEYSVKDGVTGSGLLTLDRFATPHTTTTQAVGAYRRI
jgi:hypothetical protein